MLRNIFKYKIVLLLLLLIIIIKLIKTSFPKKKHFHDFIVSLAVYCENRRYIYFYESIKLSRYYIYEILNFLQSSKSV